MATLLNKMNKQEPVTIANLWRLIELVESEERDESIPDGYIRLNDGTLVRL